MDRLLSHTGSFIKHVYWFQQDLNLKPNKKHTATAIDWTDISERKSQFLDELVNTITSWVYNKSKAKTIVDDRLSKVNQDYPNAYSFLTTQAFSKFRPGYPQGQFGELLLFNFIQFFFEAPPLLRKQRITTSFDHERFGADAIHYKKEADSHRFILGESKCYKSNYKFNDAFKTSLTSIESAFQNIDKELGLYVYDDFIEPELEGIAKKYKENSLAGC